MPTETLEVVKPMPNLAAMQRASEGEVETKEVFGAGFNFLPRLQLYTANSQEVKSLKMPMAHYGIIKGQDAPIDVGEAVLVIPLVYRAKAMFVKGEKPTAYHNPKSPEFQAIKAAADADSNSGNLYGPEFLLWLGNEQRFVTFFMCSITARNEAPAVRALCPSADGRLKTGLLKAQFIQTKDYSWHGPKIAPSSQTMDSPDPSELEMVVTTFLKPVDSVPQAEKPAAPAEAINADR